MSMSRTTSVRVGCLAILILGLAGGIVFFTRYQAMGSCHENQPPLKSMTVTIDPAQGQQFMEQSRQFAFKYGFRFDTSGLDRQGNEFRMRLIRKDVEVVARTPSSPGGFEIGFYNYDCIHPTMASDIADLVNDFKTFLSKIPNVTMTE